MAWLLRDGEVLASVEAPSSRRGRRRGLLGRDAVLGGMWLEPARSVHTVGMRFALDVAHLRPMGWSATVGDDSSGSEAGGSLIPSGGEATSYEVLAVGRMRPWRVGRLRLRARAVLEAEAGAFDRWSLRVGDVVEMRP